MRALGPFSSLQPSHWPRLPTLEAKDPYLMRPQALPHVSRIQVLLSEISPWTRDLRHVKAVIPRLWNKQRVSFLLPKFKDVKPKDRIKWWNIVPGDQVRVAGDPDGHIHEVRGINKFSNRVYLNMQNVSFL